MTRTKEFQEAEPPHSANLDTNMTFSFVVSDSSRSLSSIGILATLSVILLIMIYSCD